MTRYILCERCGSKFHLEPEDELTGWQIRRVPLFVHKPDVHQIKVISGDKTDVINLPSLLCDHCNADLADGSKVIAVTMWRGKVEPPNWESEYAA